MEKNIRNPKTVGRDATGLAPEVGWSREAILIKARALLGVGGLQARREIVRTTIELDRLLSGGF